MKLNRDSIRLQHYDYSQAGAYFVTICVHARECLFGEVVESTMALNDYGKLVEEEWLRSAEIRQELELDAFVIMPNHLHGIVVINNDDGLTAVRATGRSPLPQNTPPRGPAKKSLGSFIAGFKSATTKRLNLQRHTPAFAVWQRNYYEYILRDKIDLIRIREYVQHNPAHWAEDENNPKRVK